MNRSDVYKLIGEARDYQDGLSSDRTDGRTNTVGEELVLLQVYLQRAFSAWVDNSGDSAALTEIVKVAALAVRCMETHCNTIQR